MVEVPSNSHSRTHTPGLQEVLSHPHTQTRVRPTFIRFRRALDQRGCRNLPRVGRDKNSLPWSTFLVLGAGGGTRLSFYGCINIFGIRLLGIGVEEEGGRGRQDILSV